MHVLKPWARLVFAAAAVCAALICPAAVAGDPEPGTAKLESNVEFLPNGDVKAVLLFDIADDAYARLKRAVPNPQKFVKAVSSSRVDFEVSPASRATYDDVKSAVLLEVTQLGAMSCGGNGKWSFTVERDYEYINHTTVDGRTVFFFYGVGNVGGTPAKGQAKYKLPEKATNPEWDAAANAIRYKLARPEGSGEPQLEMSVQAKPRIMSALYKVYGLGTPDLSAQWVAKAVLKNGGESVLKDVRVRWRFNGYSEWSSWSRFPEMVPGQTAVSVYYPTLDGKIAQLTTNTPADIAYEWQFNDKDGKAHTDSDAKRVVVLGRHEFLFYTAERGSETASYAEEAPEAPLLAAFVSRDDPVVKQFAAMANKIAGGVGSTQTEATLMATMRGIYDLECRNDFTYQFPPGLRDQSVSFDTRLVQNIKFPRDVIRDKSGTCIDLAICYAAVANAIGMDVSLALIPGHCFPIVRWQGSYYPIEATCVRGGVRFATDPRQAPSSFEEAMKIGSQELRESMDSGRIVIIDVQEWWTKGVSGPELEALPSNVLSEWGISVEGVGGAPRPIPAAPQQPQQPPQPGPQPAPDAPRAEGGFEGTWTGSVPDGAGGALAVVLTLEKDTQTGGIRGKSVVRQKGQNGRTYDLVKTYVGTVLSGSLSMACQEFIITDVATGVGETGWPDGMVTAQLKDGRLVGKSSSNNGSTVEFSFERKK